MIDVTVTGIDKLQANLGRLADVGKGGSMGRALRAGALVVEGHAKYYVPVDTGNLRSSIGTEGDDKRAIVKASAEYAAYVEFGTVKMESRPYMRPAVYSHVGDIEKAAGAQLGYEIKVAIR